MKRTALQLVMLGLLAWILLPAAGCDNAAQEQQEAVEQHQENVRQSRDDLREDLKDIKEDVDTSANDDLDNDGVQNANDRFPTDPTKS